MTPDEVHDFLVKTLIPVLEIAHDADQRGESDEVFVQRVNDNIMLSLSEQDALVVAKFLKAVQDPVAYAQLDSESQKLVDKIKAALEN